MPYSTAPLGLRAAISAPLTSIASPISRKNQLPPNVTR
ncbi:hypothetical protein APX70_200611 [Pseudomonas syringae pv. maculicola]|uniref:Uncharacterized protein n=1 Tax=Pseudomonas syringae pv. maculicola TaxID=59511 RepID=A0A3M2Z3W1_PSEYM|nr:hypothetical protein APX70_200611 [Pseudomonas syringae pv. maculicola]